MLRLPSFAYAPARTLAEATQMLAEAGPDAAVMAGGTDLLPHMKRRQHLPRLVIGLRAVRELRGIRAMPDGSVRVGAGCTLAEVAEHQLIRAAYPGLAQALSTIASPAIRQMGTIGGNLCVETRCRYYDLPALTRDGLGHCLKDGGATCLAAPRSPRCWAVAASDAAPILIAMDARVRLVAAGRERVIPLRLLYCDDGLRPLALERNELLADVVLPPADAMRAAYHKVRVRGAIDFPALGVAIMVRRMPGSAPAEARIVLGAVASAPVVAEEAARILVGRSIDTAVARAAAEAASRAVRPLDNADLSAAWRRQMVRVTTARLLQSVLADGENRVPA